MSALATALAYQRLVEQSAALRLLRADHAPVIAAVLAQHLGAPGARLAADDLYELVDGDLEVLRDHVDLPQNARGYCDDWRSAGFLVRRPAAEARGETIELSPDAVVALRVLAQLEAPRSTITQSRLVNLAQAVRQLAIDTDPDVSRRLDALRAERQHIDEQIARVASGEVDVLDERQVRERLGEVLLQARDLPGDFAGVRARFEELNHQLRARVLDSDDPGAVLDDVFRGVDLIESSDEGQTFSAFSALLRDAERSSELESDLAAVLDRAMVDTLEPESRHALRSLVRDLKRGSREVHGVLTEFARGLRRYVFSQEFQRDRALRDALQEALAAAVPASRHLKPYAPLDRELELSTLRMTSVGEIAVHDPMEFRTGATLAAAEPTTVDLAALAAIARESEIDFAELIDNVNAVVDGRGEVTVAGVLAVAPATQGLASIVGLLSLAMAHGQVRSDVTEVLAWTGRDGVPRAAEVTTHVFTRRIA
ncbi:DUF3375 domain-containing protein [Nocardioides zeae]|uniref:DUF3375 domain-containing protein n=1 Tax=Nocardioides zeae TaxID=1457234 RepID=A0AAJ1U6F8_9ACTN|nr:DUF3375 domain-containing protein [Nocardioides zeae]MDQ1106078.1 hypothetical protein [Nocardioides zeae]